MFLLYDGLIYHDNSVSIDFDQIMSKFYIRGQIIVLSQTVTKKLGKLMSHFCKV
jgi:hypothetical protein